MREDGRNGGGENWGMPKVKRGTKDVEDEGEVRTVQAHTIVKCVVCYTVSSR